MSDKILTIEVQQNIATVTINRPQAMNALNSQFFFEMEAFINDAHKDAAIRAVIITGTGKAFVAGADIGEMVTMDQSQAAAFSYGGQSTFRHLELMAKPIIAAVNGFALGGGCELAMACDIRIAVPQAKFGQPEVNLGLIPGYAGTQRLPRLVGLGNALLMMFTGDMIPADEALRLGLIQKIVESDQLIPYCKDLAKKILAKGPKAISLVKKTSREGLLTGFDKGCELERENFSTLFGNEGTEGMQAFLEKRPPEWPKD